MNTELLLVYYSHSTYYPVLNVVNEYLKNISNKKILFIDKIVPEHDNLCFDEIIFYDDKLNYTKKLYNSLIQLNEDNKYIIFSLDIDILLKLDNNKLNNMTTIMDNENIDRIVLVERESLKLMDLIDLNDNTSKIGYNYEQFYYFNVQPSIWNLKSFIKLNNDLDVCYRDVEYELTQDYCKNNLKFYCLSIHDKCKKIQGLLGHDVCDTYCHIHISSFGIVRKHHYHDPPRNEDEEFYWNEYDKIIKILPDKLR
jgi:hypothetical protein